jgi:hypothetical protein
MKNAIGTKREALVSTTACATAILKKCSSIPEFELSNMAAQTPGGKRTRTPLHHTLVLSVFELFFSVDFL